MQIPKEQRAQDTASNLQERQRERENERERERDGENRKGEMCPK